jgi:parvulin-like peptidyl-prolyl isomerase
MKKHTGEKEIHIKISTMVYGFLILIVVTIAIGMILAYGTSSEVGNKIANKISKVIPFPAAIIDWRNIVYINDLQANLASVQKFYQTQNFAKEGLRIDFTTENGKKRLKVKEREVLDKMVEDRIIEILAKNKGITVSEKEVNDVVSQKLNEFGTAEEVKNDLLKSYGWSLEDFKKRVVLPNLYMEKLAQEISTKQTDTTKSKEKITQAQNELEKGKDFSDVVRSYSEGPSRDKGGELGWAKKDQVMPELQKALFGTETLAKNAIIESSIGFHIIEIENRKKQDGNELLQLRQVFVAKNTFADWLEKEKKNTKVYLPLADFTWNAKDGMVDFRDQKMRIFEKEERAKVQGDASIMF